MNELEKCVLQLSVLNKKVVPVTHFVALLQLKPPARTISKRPLFALNLAIPSPAQKAIHDSLSVLHKLEKSRET
jgi:hypothetical protein